MAKWRQRNIDVVYEGGKFWWTIDIPMIGKVTCVNRGYDNRGDAVRGARRAMQAIAKMELLNREIGDEKEKEEQHLSLGNNHISEE